MPRPGHPSRLLPGLLLTVAFGIISCGPITATTAIADATVALEAARGIQADQYAVYEFESAVLYLRKAREEEGYSDFQTAINLAGRSRAFSEKARDLARVNPARGLPAPGETVAPVPAHPAGTDLGEPSGSSL